MPWRHSIYLTDIDAGVQNPIANPDHVLPDLDFGYQGMRILLGVLQSAFLRILWMGASFVLLSCVVFYHTNIIYK